MAWLENLEQFAIDVILERRHGVRATLLRGLLYGLSLSTSALCSCGSFFIGNVSFANAPSVASSSASVT